LSDTGRHNRHPAAAAAPRERAKNTAEHRAKTLRESGRQQLPLCPVRSRPGRSGHSSPLAVAGRRNSGVAYGPEWTLTLTAAQVHATLALAARPRQARRP